LRAPLVSLTVPIVSKQEFSFSNEQDTGNPTPVVRSTPIWNPICIRLCQGLLKTQTDGDVMRVLVHCSSVCYAVIQASSKNDRPERLVIAYHEENCLRDLIAAPSIIGLGFASREEAITNLEGHMPDAAPSKQKPRFAAMFHATHENGDLPIGHGLLKHRRIPQSILQSALAAVIALFYSKNIVSAMIRMALGASF
jgi:hypothetical protein